MVILTPYISNYDDGTDDDGREGLSSAKVWSLLSWATSPAVVIIPCLWKFVGVRDKYSGFEKMPFTASVTFANPACCDTFRLLMVFLIPSMSPDIFPSDARRMLVRWGKTRSICTLSGYSASLTLTS
ncbi:hypothetical protein INT45_009476 [Circinella minor]|uniref:Uncharacterized protein n=1 Tax=Circinella minor TaxID=1195481 RepID=A0A8H7RQN8_9FUNG|nr:hypothetical protein INT45_009476 [Circinella minor]